MVLHPSYYKSQNRGSTYRSIKRGSAIALSVAALSTAQQGYAVCTPSIGSPGPDNVSCSGISAPINLSLGTDTLTNDATGTITGGAVGIQFSTGAKTITNAGTVEASNIAVAIGDQANPSGTITNQLGATIRGDNVGIGFINSRAQSSNVSVNITNDGLIQGDNIAGIYAHVETSGNQDFTGTITNNGTIAGNRGIFLNSIGSSSGSSETSIATLINNGTITGTVAGIELQASHTTSSAGDASIGTITNSGTISGDVGIFVQATASSLAHINTITNSGTIESTAGTSGTAIRFENATSPTQININGGRIIGNVTDDAPVNGNSQVNIVGSGFATEGDFTVSNLSVNAGQSFTISTGDTFNTRGMSTAGTINFEVDSAANVGALNVTDGAIDLSGGSVGAVVDAGAPLTDGQEIQIGTGTTALIGTTGASGQTLTTVNDTSLLFDFAIADGGQGAITGSGDNTSLFFLVSEAASMSSSACTPNANAAGAAFSNLSGTSNSELSSILGNIGAASTKQELEDVLQATLPQVDRSSFTATQNITGNTIRIVSDRLSKLRRHQHQGQSGVSSGDAIKSKNFWAQGFAQTINQDERDTVEGYTADTYGVSIGADAKALDHRATLGAVLSYGDVHVSSDSVNDTRNNIDAYSLTLYGDYRLDKQTYFIGSLGYTYAENDATRNNVGGVAGLDADSNYDSDQFEARFIGLHDFHLANFENTTFTAQLQGHYIHFDKENYTERGAGGANLNVDSDVLEVLEFGLGIGALNEYTRNDGSVLSTEVNIGYRYDILDEAVQTTSTFQGGGPSFVTDGANPAQGTLNVGVGLSLLTSNDWELTANYDFERKSDFESHSGLMRIAYKF